jgi:hypothetical protein
VTELLLRRRRCNPTPLSIQGCRLWLRADSFVNLSSGATPQNWVDQSLFGNTVGRSVVGERPQYITGVLDGKPVMRGDGTDDYHLRGSGSASVPGSDNWMLWGVFSNRATGTARQAALYVGESSANGYGIALRANAGNKGYLFGGVSWFDSAVAEATGFEAWILQRRSGTTRLWVGGGSPIHTTATAPNAPTGDITLFTAAGGNPYSDCDIAECGVHSGSGAMTLNNANFLGNYMASRWGVAWTTAADT